MPEALRQALLTAIAKSTNDDQKLVLLLLFQLQEVMMDKLEMLSQQLTVPTEEHTEDHKWVKSMRENEADVKNSMRKTVFALFERLLWVAGAFLLARVTGITL